MRLPALTACAVLLMTTALSAQAQTMSPSAGMPPMGGGMGGEMAGGRGAFREERLETVKQRIAAEHQQRMAEKQQRRAQEDALDNKCFAALEAATSLDALRSTHEQCRSEHEALRGQFKEERQQEMGARGGMGGRMGGGMPGPMAAK